MSCLYKIHFVIHVLSIQSSSSALYNTYNNVAIDGLQGHIKIMCDRVSILRCHFEWRLG